jgi:threonine dehydrogenase-like Zn-dependent dehydrogenase
MSIRRNIGTSIAGNYQRMLPPQPQMSRNPELLSDVLDGRIQPDRVFDRVRSIEEVPDGYCAMNDRDSIQSAGKP